MVAFPLRRVLVYSLLGLIVGCSGADPFDGDPEADYERLCAESCDRLAEVAGLLSTIEDEASLEIALPRIRSAMDGVVSAIEQQNELIASGYQPSEASASKWKARLTETMDAARPDFNRIAGIPGVEKIKTELLRATKVPKPKVRSQTASVGGRPKVSKQMQDDMKALGLVYHKYHDANGAFAKSWEEVKAFCQSSGDSPGADVLDRLRQKGVVVHWGIRFNDARVGTSNYVFAYEPKTPREGGVALHLDGFTEVVTPGQLLMFLAAQADVDLKVFGKTPPYPVKFPPGTTPEYSHNVVLLDWNKPWPPDDPIIGAKPPAAQAASKPAGKNHSSQGASQDHSSTGGSLPPKLGRGSPSSMPEPDHEPTPRPDDSTDSRPGMSNPFGRGGNPRGPFRPESPGTPGHMPGTPFGGPAQPSGPTDMGPGAADRVPSGQRPPIPFGPGSRFGSSRTTYKTADSPLVGGQGGGPKRRVDRAGRPMIGVRHRTGNWAGKDMVKRFDPLFERGRPRPGYDELFAKDGYAVGAIQVDGDKYVYAIRVAFMRIDGDRLDPKDSYVSEWIGKPTGQAPKTLNGDGAFVVGVHSRGTIILDAVGLVFKDE